MMTRLFCAAVLLCLSAGEALAQEAASEAPQPSESSTGIQPELGFQLGYAFANDIEGGEHNGPGARLQLLARFNRYIAAGPEAGFFIRAGSQRIVQPNSPHGETYTTRNKVLTQLSGVLRVGFDDGVVRPTFLAGPAISVGGFGADLFYFVGAQLTFMVDELPLFIDARTYRPITGSLTGYPNYKSLGLGTRLSW